VVGYKGQDRLILCGGWWLAGERGCKVWTEQGWLDIEGEFERADAASSMLPDGRWLVSGGQGEEGGLGTTQIYSEEKGWLDYVPMPVNLEGHCQVTVGEDVFVIGGRSWGHTFMGNKGVGFDTRSTYVLRGNTWHKLPAKLSQEVHKPACAVVGGLIYTVYYTTVEILNPEKLEDGWVQGPRLPERKDMYMVQTVVHNNTLYVVSGNPRWERWEKINPMKVYSLKQGDDHWEELEGLDIKQRNEDCNPCYPNQVRAIFPAPVIKKNALHCSEPRSKPHISSKSSKTSFDILYVIFLSVVNPLAVLPLSIFMELLV